MAAPPLAHHSTMMPCPYGILGFFQKLSQLRSSLFLFLQAVFSQPIAVFSLGLLSSTQPLSVIGDTQLRLECPRVKHRPYETGGKGMRHNFWNNDIAQGYNIKWLESNRPRCQTSWFQLDLNPQYMLTVTHQQAKWLTQRHHDSSKADHKRPKSGSGPIPGNLSPTKNSWNNPPTH